MIGYIIGAAIVGLVIGVVLMFIYCNISKQTVNDAKREAESIKNEAEESAARKKREALLEAKEEIHKNRADLEREIKERRGEMSKTERRLTQKEETLDRKTDAADKKNEELTRRLANVQKSREEAEQYKQQQLERLESISGLTRDEAKQYLVDSIEQEAQHDAAIKLREIQQQTKDDAEKYAREVISSAIQRCAADHVAEATVSVVPLPNDEMKGRIIGREGRNIRTLENLTGVDLIIDDTPEAITLSCHDPVKREIARLSLEKLIQDGRIHPTRIEETVEKARREVETKIKQDGERAVIETGVHHLHPELMRLLGRMRYRTSYGQNVLEHSIEVAKLAGSMAAELGLDPTLARRAGLLHDIGKSLTHEIEGSHVAIGVELAKKFKETPEVIHAIEAHHGDVEAKTVVACLVQAADAVSAARPGARRENLENYIKRLEKLESIATSFEGVEKSYAIQAGREIRIILKPEVISDDQMVIVAREIAKKIEEEMDYPGQIKVNVVRETRAVDYAK